MTDKQTVIDAINRFPESVMLSEIADELRIMSSMKRGREDILAGRSKSHEEVSELLKSWSAEWASK